MAQERIVPMSSPESAPRYQLRVQRRAPTDIEYEIWQVPAAATPQVTTSQRVAGLRGRNLELIEPRVLKRLAQSGVKLGRIVDPKNAITCSARTWH